MLRQSGHLFRLFARHRVHRLQAATVIASGKPLAEPLKNSQHQTVFPVPEAVLTQIRRDVLLKDAYNGRVINKRDSSIKLMIGKWKISDLCASSAKQQLEVLSQQELVDFMQELAHAALSGEMLDNNLTFLPILEDECCSRAKDLDSAALLLVADAFFVMRYRCSRYFSSMFREFEHRWAGLAIRKEDVVQLAMCIITARKFPRLLVGNIEKFICSNADDFSAGELSVICSAFFITNTSFGSIEVMEKVANAVLRGLHSGTLKIYQLGSILKSLRHAHFSKISFYDSLGNLLSRSAAFRHESTLTDLSNIAFTYASLRISSPTLFARISSNAVRLLQNQGRMRIKDIGRLVWSFALLQQPLDAVVQNQLVFLLKRDVHLMEEFSEAFIEALSGLAMKEIYPVELLQKFLSTKFPKQKHGMVNFAVVFCVVLYN